eukprot:1605194-Pyramimonas_sp.AAC.1
MPHTYPLQTPFQTPTIRNPDRVKITNAPTISCSSGLSTSAKQPSSTMASQAVASTTQASLVGKKSASTYRTAAARLCKAPRAAAPLARSIRAKKHTTQTRRALTIQGKQMRGEFCTIALTLLHRNIGRITGLFPVCEISLVGLIHVCVETDLGDLVVRLSL